MIEFPQYLGSSINVNRGILLFGSSINLWIINLAFWVYLFYLLTTNKQEIAIQKAITFLIYGWLLVGLLTLAVTVGWK